MIVELFAIRKQTMTSGVCWILALYVTLLRALLMEHLFSSIYVTARDYCLDDIVEMQCNANEILLVESAKYGRMRIGQCVKADYGFIGCGSDVTNILAGKCSGRRHCRIFNLEVTFSGVEKLCPADLKSYLEAKFRCVKVAAPPVESSSCHPGIQLNIQSSFVQSGLISSMTSYEHGVGDASCPWIISAAPGQRINLTLMDFSDYEVLPSSSFLEQSPGLDPGKRGCRELAEVEEMKASKAIISCNSQSRSTLVYSSKTNRITVSLNSKNLLGEEHLQNPSHFIIKYDVYGCPYPTYDRGFLPTNTHLEVDTDVDMDSIRIQCNQTDESWILRCSRNGTWTGHLGNCTQAANPLAEGSTIDKFSYGMSLLLILVVALSICFIFLATGLLCLYRSKQLQRQARTKNGFVVALSNYSSNRGSDITKSSTVPRSQPLNNHPVYCPLDSKFTTLRPLEDDSTPAVFHTLQDRRPVPVSSPLIPRTVPGQGFLLHRQGPCTCALRPSGPMTSWSAAGLTRSSVSQTQTSPLVVEDHQPLPTATFTTFKPASPENEYGTPKPRVNRWCQDPNCCWANQVTRGGPNRALSASKPCVDVHQNNANEGNITV